MKTNIYVATPNKPSRSLYTIRGDCLERAGLKIPYGGYAIIDCSIVPEVGDFVHCNNAYGSISGFIKQIKEFKGETVIVGTSYIDESKDFTFEASEIYGVVTEVFCKLWNKQIYCRDNLIKEETGTALKESESK